MAKPNHKSIQAAAQRALSKRDEPKPEFPPYQYRFGDASMTDLEALASAGGSPSDLSENPDLAILPTGENLMRQYGEIRRTNMPVRYDEPRREEQMSRGFSPAWDTSYGGGPFQKPTYPQTENYPDPFWRSRRFQDDMANFYDLTNKVREANAERDAIIQHRARGK